jgi:hypothetical protein
MAFFKAYLQGREQNASLAEESEVAVIDLAHELYVLGNKSYLKEIETRLSHPDKVVKYYAAFKLSYVKDRAAAAKALPVLKGIVRDESDAELRDRAKIALLRIDPASLASISDEPRQLRPRLLRIEITEGGTQKLKIGIPWALADLAIHAIPEREKQLLRDKGYDLERIMRELQRTKTSIIEISEDEGNTLIKIWIE